MREGGSGVATSATGGRHDTHRGGLAVQTFQRCRLPGCVKFALPWNGVRSG